jgi:putative DNA primase/helicase
MSPAAEMAIGHWNYLLPALGVDVKYLKNEHGPCPICGGKDRFRWDDRNHTGTFICSQCGAGDGFDLARKVTGKTFREIAEQIAQILGKDTSLPKKEFDKEEHDNKMAMQAVWEASGQPSRGGAVWAYMTRRFGCYWPSKFIREHKTLRTEGANVITMVSKIVSHNDRAVNLHLTYLTTDGHKADVVTQKRVMKGKLPDGCAIRLAPPASRMGVAEGIESAISASILYDMPVWACVNGGLLSKWIPPEIAEEIYIFGDNDENFCGHAKAFQLANRLVTQYKRKVEILYPETIGQDFNDLHREMMQSGHTVESYMKVVK